jgi:uncharacterized RDD family membrane protein YckC
MKCPKCSYLGFETGDRCKNCGYDFSLIEACRPQDAHGDVLLHSGSIETSDPREWRDQVDRGLAQAPAESGPAVGTRAAAVSSRAQAEPSLPLFGLADGSDEPLIRLPAAPRPPLSVRRTPDMPRLRAVPRPRPVDPEPVLAFADGPEDEETAPTAVAPRRQPAPVVAAVSGPGARLAAAAVDQLLLLAIDLSVVYFALRVAGLTMADWGLLPAAPLVSFLLLLKLSYFSAFTAVGGQTIGKMACGIRVVTDDGLPVDGARALRRALAGAMSTAGLGLGFVPALTDVNRRTLHDRVARTRVIALRPA